MTSFDPDELGKTAPINLSPSAPPPPASSAAEPVSVDAADDGPTVVRPAYSAAEADPRSVVLRPASAAQQEVLFIPLAVNIGDGFKFGCGFFLAMVLAMLVGFVLLTLLFVLTGLLGLNLPISR